MCQLTPKRHKITSVANSRQVAACGQQQRQFFRLFGRLQGLGMKTL
jgi:hypothetical protein